MARNRRRRPRRSYLVVASTAMIDVIFILLAFFLSVSQIKKSTVKVELPEVSEAVATGEREEDSTPSRHIMQVSAQGEVYLGDQRMDDVAHLYRTFDEQVARDREAGRPTVVEIITDRRSETGILVDIINYLTKKKVRRLEFLAVEKSGPGSD